jgi:hypothetical protein
MLAAASRSAHARRPRPGPPMLAGPVPAAVPRPAHARGRVPARPSQAAGPPPSAARHVQVVNKRDQVFPQERASTSFRADLWAQEHRLAPFGAQIGVQMRPWVNDRPGSTRRSSRWFSGCTGRLGSLGAQVALVLWVHIRPPGEDCLAAAPESAGSAGSSPQGCRVRRGAQPSKPRRWEITMLIPS